MTCGLPRAVLVSGLIAITPMQVKAEPISVTLAIAAIVKGTIAYFGGKAALTYGVSKLVVTKAGTIILKKQTITLASGAKKVVVLAVSATAMSKAFANAGVTAEINDDSAEMLSDKAMDLFSDGQRTMTQKVCTGPDGKSYPVFDWMNCGEGTSQTVELDLDSFVIVQD